MSGAAAPALPERPPTPPLWLLTLVTFSGTLAMHIFVPALPAAARDLGASTATMQGAISFYLVGLAVGQLFYGPVSDVHGRKPVLMVGLALYTLAGLAALLAPGAGVLIGARLIQALGGCAGLALGRAMVRDTAGPQEAASRLALLNLMVSAGPGLAPAVGGALTATLGWRSIFALLCLMGATSILLCWWRLPETGRRVEGVNAASLIRDYAHLLRSPVFGGYALGGACTTTTMYAFIAASPFIFVNEMHRPVAEVGLYLGIMILGLAAGSLLASRLVRRISIDRLMVGAGAAALLGSCVFLLVVLSGRLSVPLVVGPLVLVALGCGIASPMALTRSVSVNPALIGSAAGLYGFGQMAWGALCSALVGQGQDPALSAALILVGGGVLGQLAFQVAGRSRASDRPKTAG
ncbi:multidrug effflux MFS transporter [Roseomonas elaeocarpi]|uniref:Bcr/CflA family efflux transporter n=1 Tax=Roseomonas elaeocarpi TaxID=907779 RepID=A0ABV6JSP8_9PROT